MVPANAIGLLEQDHREAEAFFAQFETDEERRAELARKICLALTVHAAIEDSGNAWVHQPRCDARLARRK